jgi:hypothetical protein
LTTGGFDEHRRCRPHGGGSTLVGPERLERVFGLFTNVLLNVIVLSGLCLGVVHMPDDIVYGRILPALGIALPLG